MTTEDDAYEKIRAAIANGEMHPNERLIEADLSARFEASRSAVRTALVRLQQEGIVERKRNHGAKVRLIGEAEAIEIYETRAVLEGLAARKAATSATDAQVGELRGLVVRIRASLAVSDLASASNVNAELHAAILRIGQQATAQRLVNGLNTHLVRFHYRTIMQPERPQRSLAEHEAIVEAIATHDPELAEKLVREHLELVIDTLRLPLPR